MTGTAWAIVALVAAPALLSLPLVVLNKARLRGKAARERRMSGLVRSGEPLGRGAGKREAMAYMEAYVELRQSLEPRQECVCAAEAVLAELGLEARYARQLGSRLARRRMGAAAYLGYFASQDSARALRGAFATERDGVTRFYMAAALVLRADLEAIAPLVDSLRGSSPAYRGRLVSLLCEYGEELRPLVSTLLDDRDPGIVSLIVRFAGLHPSEELRSYLLRVSAEEPSMRLAAVRSLAAQFPQELADPAFLRSPSFDVARVSIESLARVPSERNLELLLGLMPTDACDDGDGPTALARAIAKGVAEMTRRSPFLLQRVLDEFLALPEGESRSCLAEVLSFRAEYFIAKLLSARREEAKEVLAAVLSCGKYSDMIGFLNRNKSPEIENELLSLVRTVMADRPDLAENCRLYLNPRALAKLGLEAKAFGRTRREEKREGGKTAVLAVILGLVAASLPAVVVARAGLHPATWASSRELLAASVIDFNRLFAYYSITVNSIYLFLLLFSLVGSRRQSRAMRVKRTGLLFRPGMLPSVSIIAPAYCEESTIVESVRSLLNLKYPDYELIVVNDGSGDQTLNRLIDSFGLEKVDLSVEERLKTMPLRGIYRNPALPLLTVVDKNNGGKADSLNAGINVSSKDYFCGIDADSLLEPEALLSVAAGALDTEREFVAAGGNIFPVNGCEVDRGSVSRIGLPRNPVARFQTIEYIRAFMGSRVGWAYFDSLLIISGAFGLFGKERVIEVGGYLTSSGQYRKDTVGEDMELVVRLKRHMLEAKLPHEFQYAFNANCWTEVPESMAVLHRQRDRWHRGLIDILYFHRKMIGNPRYGRVGTAAFPYFLVFEVVGPLYEVLGWLMVATAAVMGLLDAPLAILLFFATISMGIFISEASLLIAESDREYFPPRDMARLLGFALLENFGFRQLVSFWRVGGYFSSMRKPKGWGKMVRKGFAAQGVAGRAGSK